jgi:hypothetical protein
MISQAYTLLFKILGAPIALRKWLSSISKTFGFNFVVTLFFIQHVLKGFTFGAGTAGWVGTPSAFLYRELGVTASKMQRLQAIATTPWSIKPIIGFISDLVAIRGYHKTPYMILSTITAALSFLALSFLWPVGENIVTLLLFLMYLQCSLCDLLSEAKYSQKLKEHPTEGPSLMSFVWGGIFFSQLCSTGTVGGIITYVGTNWVYLFCFFPCVSLLLPLLKNWMGEAKSEVCDLLFV